MLKESVTGNVRRFVKESYGLWQVNKRTCEWLMHDGCQRAEVHASPNTFRMCVLD